MFRKLLVGKTWILAVTMVLAAAAGRAGTFGTVVSIGGEAADLALDEVRGVLYVADFTGSRIDVISLSTQHDQDVDQRAQPAQFDFGIA